MKQIKFFDNQGKTFSAPFTEVLERVFMEQMARPAKKRLYVCGIEFYSIVSAEVVVE